jgi:hypothetical protein
VAFDPSGRRLASVGGDKAIRLWDVRSGRQVGRIVGHEWRFEPRRVFPSPGVGLLADPYTCLKHTKSALYDLDLRRELCTLAHWNGETAAVSPDGTVFATGGGPIRLREFATGADLPALPEGHRGPMTVLAFSPDGKRLASAGGDGSILVWDWPAHVGLTGQPRRKGTAQELTEAWGSLADPEATKAYRAIGSLVAAGKDAVAFLGERLRPVTDEQWKPMRRLLADLDSGVLAVRQRAAAELAKLGAEAWPVLEEALIAGTSLEVQRRLEPILEGAALKRWSSESIRQFRALQVLERSGTTEARQILRRLATGVPVARLTQEAQAALRRLAEAEAPGGNTTR